jgi:serine/threonine-protein kinase RsbW
LAVTEATTNALIHGYARGTGRVHLMVQASAAQFVVTVTDTGSGLTPRTDSPGLGAGLAIIATVTEDLEISTPPGGGTRVRMAFPRS